MQIHYSVRPDPSGEHRGEFTLELSDAAEPLVDLVFPSWVPGSYWIAEYQRSIGRFTAHAGDPELRPLRVERVDKGRWRIHTEGARTVVATYSVYGYQMVDEALDVTDDHLFLNAALCLPYIDGHAEVSSELTVHVPPDWQVISELEQLAREPARFRAANYDELVDSPIDAGHPLVLTIRPGGIPHRIVLCGRGGNFEAHRLEEDIGKIVQATIALVGGSPLERYTFFIHLTDTPDGGLEHATSTSCVVARTAFRPAESYRRFLSLIAHEYFHLYNVKRIRPRVLQRFDYTRENYTRLLWWMEGTTSYFDRLLLRRAGLATPAQFLESFTRWIGPYLQTPGRRWQSLEESSFATWIDHYKPFEESANQSIDYYVKGGLVSLCLDLHIRHATENRASLESAFRRIWAEHGSPDRGIGEEELQPILQRATGLELGSFFDRYVRGTEEIDFSEFARYAGLSLGPAPRPPDEEEEGGYLGIQTVNSSGLVKVRTVLAGGPAGRAGLSPGDEIVAIDGAKVLFEGFDKIMKRYPPGSKIELSVFQRGLLNQRTLETGRAPPEKYELRPVDSPTDLERAVYLAWVGAPWEAAAPAQETKKR
ncbi:MAG TPA: PDZ domain-containing protein [Thermoplasmata archaeon]|nr:PDZ domain-containing protein [Thermoplasmata archaeon]